MKALSYFHLQDHNKCGEIIKENIIRYEGRATERSLTQRHAQSCDEVWLVTFILLSQQCVTQTNIGPNIIALHVYACTIALLFNLCCIYCTTCVLLYM